ncbi:hypothetical protein OPKNFCMD_6268 [Methylobacterium crusticola]|uniref:PAS fold-3 domain-containing protein n=1 Tax=Methylobacterium crusticola TaxID=1697972 RepID=A0ABQ4R7Y6_9HYPH|nr:PAS domain-containing protein [Methylobacterium crusticola]GJD53492.1 hypothetical protein OPKNFCMD_6268 [Methylobacterium crusticola]
MAVVMLDGARARRSELLAALDAVGVIGTWSYHPATGRITLDAALARLYGLGEAGPHEVPFDRFLDGLHPGDREQVSAALARAVAAGDRCRTEHRVLGAAGAVRRVAAYGAVQEAGGPCRGIAIDISDEARGGHDDGAVLDAVAGHCLAARQALGTVRSPLVRRLIDMTLMEVGLELGRLLRRGPP